MPIVKNAIISCAGMGTRLGLNKTKCLIQVDGKSIIEHQLDLLSDFKNIFIVVGFQFMDVIQHVESLNKKNIIFVFNHEYKSTSNIFSVNKVVSVIKNAPIFILDGDVIMNKEEFNSFVQDVENNPSENRMAISESETENAIFAIVNSGKVIDFSYHFRSKYEWCGLAYLKNLKSLEEKNISFVFEKLKSILPSPYSIVSSFEIDTPSDLIKCEHNLKKLKTTK